MYAFINLSGKCSALGLIHCNFGTFTILSNFDILKKQLLVLENQMISRALSTIDETDENSRDTKT